MGGIVKLLTMVAVTSIAFGATGVAGAQEEQAKSNGCLKCHAVAAKKVGPAFKDTAAKFKGNADAEAMLVEQLSAGKPNAEGKKHPPIKASADDVKSLVKWILSL